MTAGAGVKDVVKPSKRAHAAYRRAMYVPNKAYNKDRSAGNGFDQDGNRHWLQRGEPVSFKEFVKERAEDDTDFADILFGKKLAHESGTAFRKRNGLSPKPPNLKKLKSDKSGGKKK